MRSAADGREQIARGCQVDHFLDNDAPDHPAPFLHPRQVLRGQSLVLPLLHRERGEEVATEDLVLEFGRLGQQVHELRAVLDTDRDHATSVVTFC